jgi:hypothetical protein
MEIVERMVKSAFNMFGLDLIRAQNVDCLFLPIPSKEIIEKTAKSFDITFFIGILGTRGK